VQADLRSKGGEERSASSEVRSRGSPKITWMSVPKFGREKREVEAGVVGCSRSQPVW